MQDLLHRLMRLLTGPGQIRDSTQQEGEWLTLPPPDVASEVPTYGERFDRRKFLKALLAAVVVIALFLRIFMPASDIRLVRECRHYIESVTGGEYGKQNSEGETDQED